MAYKQTLAAIAALAAFGIAQPALAAATPAARAATAPKARVSMPAARATALRLAPGKIISSEYEHEGSGWRYSFDIQQKNHVQEIGIDAMTGKVVENKSEGKHDRDADKPAPQAAKMAPMKPMKR